METSSRDKAEAAAEVELAPVTNKVAFTSAGPALKAFGLAPVFDKVFEGVEVEEESVQASSDALVSADDVRGRSPSTQGCDYGAKEGVQVRCRRKKWSR